MPSRASRVSSKSAAGVVRGHTAGPGAVDCSTIVAARARPATSSSQTGAGRWMRSRLPVCAGLELRRAGVPCARRVSRLARRKVSAWSRLRTRTWSIGPPKPLTVSRVVRRQARGQAASPDLLGEASRRRSTATRNSVDHRAVSLEEAAQEGCVDRHVVGLADRRRARAASSPSPRGRRPACSWRSRLPATSAPRRIDCERDLLVALALAVTSARVEQPLAQYLGVARPRPGPRRPRSSRMPLACRLPSPMK